MERFEDLQDPDAEELKDDFSEIESIQFEQESNFDKFIDLEDDLFNFEQTSSNLDEEEEGCFEDLSKP